MTVCYLIQTYKNPEQIYRLVKLIANSTSNSFILISHNFNSCSLNTSLFKELKNVAVIPNNGVMMGSFAILQGFFDAIDWLLNKKIKFDWLINLSGQDYPTQPLNKFENFLENTKYDAFIEYFDVLSKQSPWNKRTVNERYLYNYKHFQQYLSPWQRLMLKPIKHILNNCQPLIRLDNSYGVAVGIKSFHHLFDNNFTCYGGSYFATFSRQCAIYLYFFVKENPSVVNYYKKTFIPEESLIQTILVNSKKFNLYNNNYRYTNFINSRHGHPRILSSEDYSAITKDNIYFARKFDMTVDSVILDKLDRRIFIG
ncbi:N-acetylglucosaminyltransferase [Plectonema cf. radiosum LEGE 06105]|uniref:Peptide O-xylosyltransferase n=1 Tax=Plectonema cf. radiosum LEGE 06105 TaxID=945769 RepID=A0A8J7FDP6_9CYAN|nr:beta-1,6-N-acetylglucosaminyltransferase [Plectonema radiosum]MBE9212351.1 N-acetylglucosaminyltransferase [Plectonema cf. radiosum LEGE 06105]